MFAISETVYRCVGSYGDRLCWGQQNMGNGHTKSG